MTGLRWDQSPADPRAAGGTPRARREGRSRFRVSPRFVDWTEARVRDYLAARDAGTRSLDRNCRAALITNHRMRALYHPQCPGEPRCRASGGGSTRATTKECSLHFAYAGEPSTTVCRSSAIWWHPRTLDGRSSAAVRHAQEDKLHHPALTLRVEPEILTRGLRGRRPFSGRRVSEDRLGRTGRRPLTWLVDFDGTRLCQGAPGSA